MIDPGKNKCGLVLGDISEKKIYKAIIIKSELIEDYVRNLIKVDDISKLLLAMALLAKRLKKNWIFSKKK